MSVGTLNGSALERASLVLPTWGNWVAEVQVSSGNDISGSVELELAGALFRGTVVSGNVYRERGWYRIVGGAAGWRKKIDPISLRDGAGVKLSQAIGAAARAAGEQLAPITTDNRIGPAFDTPEAEASLALELLARESWYVDELGVTHLGARADSAYSGSYVVLDKRPDHGLVTIAADDISGLVPGISLEGITVASVRHELTPDTLRTHLWASLGWGDRFVGALARLVAAFTRGTFYHGRYEYRVDSTGDTHLDLSPVRSALGLPRLAAVPMRAGSPGCAGTPAIGSTCEVQFLDGDPTRPSVVGFEGPEGNSFKPTIAKINATTEVDVGENASLVKVAGGAQFLALSNQVNARLQEFAGAFMSATPAPNDGGAAIQTAVKVALGIAGWSVPAGTPPTTAATKVKGT
jgi:hypothetical protein